jgi:hypothetical protein
LRDIVLEGAELTFLEQGVLGVQDRQDFTLFVGDLDLAMIQGTAMEQALTHHLPVGVEGLPAGRIQAGKLLAFSVPADIVTVAHMEIKACHV